MNDDVKAWIGLASFIGLNAWALYHYCRHLEKRFSRETYHYRTLAKEARKMAYEALVKVTAMEKSTHKVEWVPVPTAEYQNDLEQYKPQNSGLKKVSASDLEKFEFDMDMDF